MNSDQEQLMVKNEDNSVVQLYLVGTVKRYMKNTIQLNTVKKGRDMEMENEEGVKEKWVAAWQHLGTGEQVETAKKWMECSSLVEVMGEESEMVVIDTPI